MSILREIVRAKRRELKEGGPSMADAKARARDAPPPRPFEAALRREDEVALIAEIKRASPVKGAFDLKLDAGATAAVYEGAGAAAVSVLTNAFFRGKNEDLIKARAAAKRTPVLRKEFTIDPVQIWEARGLGADAVLLLAQLLDKAQLREFREIATELGMAALVEAHTEKELEQAIESGARIVGVNNRDLETFQVDLGRSVRLRERVPREIVFVSESGISERSDVERLRKAGVDAVLVGEELVRAVDPAARIRELFDPKP